MPVPTPTPPGAIIGDDGDMDSIIGGDTEIQAVPDKEQPTRSNVYPTTVYVYKYNNASWKDQLSAIETYTVNANGVVSLANTQSYTYDSMGNPINYNGVGLTWQGKQLKSHATTNGYMTTVLHFAYDENGLRTEKGFASNKTYYYYNGTVLIGMQKGNIAQRFSYDSSGKVVSVDYSTNGGSSYTTYYYLRSAQGDIVKLIDNNRNTVVEYTYDSWGKILAATGSLATSLGQNQPFRYRGYVYDNETGWYYLQSRYYDPTTCRFISSDVYLSTGQGVLGHNSYAYCGNNPINFEDPSGQMRFGILVHMAIQEYMINNNICGLKWFKNVTVDRNRFGKGNVGYVDLVDSNGGAYEIKPAIYIAFANSQLDNYVNASLKANDRDYPFDKLERGTEKFSGGVTVGTDVVEFSCYGDGIIIYKIKGDNERNSSPNFAFDAVRRAKEMRKADVIRDVSFGTGTIAAAAFVFACCGGWNKMATWYEAFS